MTQENNHRIKNMLFLKIHNYVFEVKNNYIAIVNSKRIIYIIQNPHLFLSYLNSLLLFENCEARPHIS